MIRMVNSCDFNSLSINFWPSITKIMFSGFNFGNTNQQQKPKQVDPLLQRLHKIRDSYDSNNTSYRFQAVVYNQKAASAAGTTSFTTTSTAPKCATADEWAQYQAASPNPEKMEPSMLCGFQDLDKRMDMQASVVELMRKKLKDMQTHISEIRASYNELVKDRLTRLTAQNNEINTSLMELLQKEEVNALSSHPFSKEEHEIYDKLEELKQEIHRPNKYISALNTLNLNAKMARENFEVRPEITVDDETMKRASEVIKTNSEALKALIKVIKKTYKTTDMIMNELNP
ncbi:hypothetical protein TRFO_23737 [Tritrichomonas foetus]|uniref:Nucleoporin Nup54 alpha-helical domain-containing protein n=1 Tax=Tritrichomonas foetus TaxID=1144522 RepID=A0A1J4KES1_9EUKA|nr:hypothetical protein TRFO_23737 [Tritrichomonas foetus]|eukprot:OHT07877.1 hypothetical protein TRFO_23737 [Tritrichomonas foetus]